ncbi:MAG TPA: nucleotide exchange factor GrpE [Streptosporangiaceae bacterium]|nr:nucleotide exchange factor GrpE [Streptosporangiaceae bacterium]
MTSPDETDARPVIRDRRRIDPVTGKVREPAQQNRPDEAAPGRDKGEHVPRHAATGDEATGAAAAAQLAAQLAERTVDLQRVQAEYANYRKRVERDRVAVREQALANVLTELLPILDNIGRAREHGELAGGFKSVAESIEAAAGKLGLSRYGERGEPFDPNVHEALMHSFSDEVSEPTCVQILQPGYKVGERILRPSRVAVAEPGGDYDGGEPGGLASERPRPPQLEPETPQDRGS